MTTIKSNPLEIVSISEPSLTLNNTVDKWKLIVTNNKLVFNNNSSNKAEIDNSSFSLYNGNNALALDASNVQTSYSITFPTNAPLDNQVMAYNGTNFAWQNLFNYAVNTIDVTKNPNAGQFLTIYSAVQYALTLNPSVNNPILIRIFPGVYNETQSIVLPNFVYIVGQSLEACEITSDVNNIITMTENSGISFVKFTNCPNIVLNCSNCGDYIIFHKIELFNCPKAINCIADSSNSLIYLEYVSCTDSSDYAINIDSNGYNCYVTIENFYTYGVCANGIIINGSNSFLTAQSSVFEGNSSGTAILINSNSNVNLRASYINNWDIAIDVPDNANNVILYLAGILFNDCVINLNILSVSCSGYFDGYSEYNKTFINKNCGFFITNVNRNIITVSAKGSDFTSIKEANDFITDASITNQYTIYVGPGQYIEDTITIKPHVSISGFSEQNTVVLCKTTSSKLFVLSPLASLSNLTLGTLLNTQNIFEYSGNNTTSIGAYVYSIVFLNANYYFNLSNANGPLYMLINNCSMLSTSNFKKFINYTDNGTNQVYLYINTILWAPEQANDLECFFDYSSSAVTNNIINIYMTDITIGQTVFKNGIGMQAHGAISLYTKIGAFLGFNTAISLPNNSIGAPYINFSELNFINNDMDINIEHINAQGNISVTSELHKITIADSSQISTFINVLTSGILMSGPLYQGDEYSKATNVTEQIQRGSNMGILTGGIITKSNTTTILIGAGNGYVQLGTSPNVYIKYITWIDSTLTGFDNNSFNWIYVNYLGVVTFSDSKPSLYENIILGTVKYGTDIQYVQNVPFTANRLGNAINNVNQNILGALFGSGCITTVGSSPLKLSVTSGSYAYGSNIYNPSQTDDITMIGYYSTGYNTLSSIPLQYDNNGTLTDIPNGSFAKHLLMIVGDGSCQQYLFIYGQELFGTENEALGGSLPNKPTFITENVINIASIIINDSSIVDIIDIRPTLSFKAGTVSGTDDHNSLQNLTVGNAHPQYFRVDGTSTMQANINLSTYNIVGNGTNQFDGITVSAHASRHLPNGADSLGTGGTPSTLSTTNSAGTANGYALIDHVHAHGNQTDPTLHAAVTSSENGFMISTDKQKLDNATSSATPSTLMLRDTNADTNVRRIILNNGLNTISLVSQASSSYILTLPATSGIIGQYLVNTGSGSTTWQTVSIATPQTIGTTNSIGTANNTFAAADHIHAHGSQTDPTLHAAVTSSANGFMISTDKQKLDNATSAATPSTLMLRDTNADTNVRRIILKNAANANTTTLVSQASSSYNLTLPATSGIIGQYLVNSGSGLTSWQNIPIAIAQTISTSNSAGTLNGNYAAADHIHAHGSQTDPSLHAEVTQSSNGFMIAYDKQKLDNATDQNIRNTLCLRDENGGTGLTYVRYVSEKFINKLYCIPEIDFDYRLPGSPGISTQVLTTDGIGNLYWENVFINPMTNDGDMVYYFKDETLRLPIGTENQVLTVKEGLPRWLDPQQNFINPMTTYGDMIYNSTFGPERLPIGTNNYVLTVSGGAPAWLPTQQSFINPMTTTGDIIYNSVSGPARLPIGTTNQILSVSSGLPSWINSPFQNLSNINNQISLIDDFKGNIPTTSTPGGETNWLISATSGTITMPSALNAADLTRTGIFSLNLPATATANLYISLHNGYAVNFPAGYPFTISASSWTIEAAIRIVKFTPSTTSYFMFGLFDRNNIANVNNPQTTTTINGFGFYISSSNWSTFSGNGTTSSLQSTSVANSTNWVTLRISKESGGSIIYSINGTTVTSPATALLSGTVFLPAFKTGKTSNTGAAATTYIDYITINMFNQRSN